MPQQLRKHGIFLLTLVATIAYIGWRSLYTLPFEYGAISLALGIILLVCEVVAAIEATEQYINMVHYTEPERPDIPDSWFPDVDVFIPTHNESVDVLYKTINACIHMDYPDKSKVHIHLCDDTDREEMRELAGQMGVGYFGMSDNTEAKAGNLNNAIFKTGSPLIVIFDADMIPRHSFLIEMVPYFFLPLLKKDESGKWVRREEQEMDEHYKIGFVQSPQSFYNADLFQFNLYAEDRIPNEQDYFFRNINVGRNRNNAALFAGSNAMLARQALLAVGGIATGTITEDFETGLRIQAKGYRTYAISKALAHGIAPYTIPSLISQRERWARGCVQSLRNVGLFRRSGLPWGAKISYFFCLIYWWTFARRSVYIIMPIVAALFGVHVVDCTLPQLLLFWLPYYLLQNKTVSILSGKTRTQHWSNLIDTILFPYLILPVIAESLGIKKKKFVVTKKSKELGSAGNFTFALPHLFLLVTSILALGMCVLAMIIRQDLYDIIIAFWLVVNGKNLILAVFFMLGRENLRRADRFAVSLPAGIVDGDRHHAGVTADISENGLAIIFDRPYFFSDDKPVKVHVSYARRYRAEMDCSIVNVSQLGNRPGWRYSLKIESMTEENRREYCQIVYDRHHTLAHRIKGTLSVYDDFSINVDRRLDKSMQRNIRKLPRITFNVEARGQNGLPVLVRDFNYKFIWILTPFEHGEMRNVTLAPGLTFELAPTDGPANREEGTMFHVVNWADFVDNPLFGAFVDTAMERHRLFTPRAV